MVPSTGVTPPPRLHVVLRPGSPRAVVFRRGGTRIFCSIGWDLATDRFRVGQWCKHKIYPRRSDVSPDGKWMVYFALNGRWHSETRGSFTAVSRAPYLKARWLWPQGDTWGGGGLLQDAPARSELFRIERNLRLAQGSYASYPVRLVRDGWTPAAKGFTRPVGAGWLLRKIVLAEPREAHELVGPRTTVDLPDWEWADFDAPRRRIVWAERGTICATTVDQNGLADLRQLFDANPMRFEPIPAPYEDEPIIVS